MAMTNPEIHVLPAPAEVASDAAQRVLSAVEESLSLKGRFSIALAGGSTPKMLYELLAQEPYRSGIDWTKVHVFFGDERCVPPDHADSNYRMAHAALLSKVPLPPDNVYRMKGELDPAAAAAEYDQQLSELFVDNALDLVLLGMGDDGHTASLFPGTAALEERDRRCVANHVPQLNTWRLTLTAPFINQAWQVMVLVTGQAKAQRLQEVLEGDADPQRLPIQLIKPEVGRMVWLMDRAAAAM
jgi:6-phosphogluconolactonase